MEIKMKLNRFLSAAAVGLMVAAGGCDRGLTDINANPNEPEAVPAENLLAWAQMRALGGAYGTHGVWSGLYMFNLWAQHLAAPTYTEEDSYRPRVEQVTGVWDATFVVPLEDLNEIKDIAQAEGNPNLFAVAEILTQYLFHYLTDTYGDIPYSEALRAPEITQPRYDPQSEIYPAMLSAVATAVGQINRGTTATAFAGGDLIFAGNMERWYRFGNSLRMRMAMRMSNVNETAAREAFVAAYSDGGLQSNADNPALVWTAAPPAQNPRFDQFFNANRRDQVVSYAMVSRLQALNDPRLPVYAQPAPADGQFRGLINGLTPSEMGYAEPQMSPPGIAFLQATSPSVIMNYAEVLFLRAEAAERGWIQADAEALYRSAIRASLEEHGVSQGQIDTYLAQASIGYEGLPSIWTQKWIALYLVGVEAFAEVRRTGWPQLTPASGTQIPRRLPYPTQEQLYNPQNYRPEVTLFTPMWWQGG
jgi:hypothetical protein